MTPDILPIDDAMRPLLSDFFRKQWGSSQMVSRGVVHQLDRLPGFVAMSGRDIKGIITYRLDEERSCEIVSLDSFDENKGIGSRLLQKVVDLHQKNGWKKLWLITSNDNTRALHFYQKRGFRLTNVYWFAIDEARKIKPEIPLFSEDGIPIQHEIELTYGL